MFQKHQLRPRHLAWVLSFLQASENARIELFLALLCGPNNGHLLTMVFAWAVVVLESCYSIYAVLSSKYCCAVMKDMMWVPFEPGTWHLMRLFFLELHTEGLLKASLNVHQSCLCSLFHSPGQHA